jgi:hypothetical protein
MVVAFYCLATLDMLGVLESAIKAEEREEWGAWIWRHQVGTLLYRVLATRTHTRIETKYAISPP